MRLAGLLLAVLLSACAQRPPRVACGELAAGLEPFLARHPLAAGQNIRADEVGRTSGASYHLVQVRGAERPHHHAQHDLTVVVLRGHGTLTRGDARHAMRVGDSAVVPRADPHWFANGGRSPAVAFVVFTPPLDGPDTVPID